MIKVHKSFATIILIFIVFAVGCKLNDNKIRGDIAAENLLPLTINSSFTNLKVGESYTLDISGGSGGYVFSVLSGPATINNSTGKIQTLFELGTVVIRVTDSQGNYEDISFENEVASMNLPNTGSGLGSDEIRSSSTHVVYTADIENNGVNELYSAGFDGTITKLNPVIPASNITKWEFNFDKTKVFFTMAPTISFEKKLYVVNVDGTNLIELSESLAAGRSVGLDFAVSPIENKVAYSADRDSDDNFELYTKAIGDASSTKVVTVGHGSGIISRILISPNGLMIGYIADKDTPNLPEVYTVSISGGASTKISGAMADEALQLYFTPDSQSIVYLAEEQNPTKMEFYSADVGLAASSVKLHANLPAGGDCYGNYFKISADSQKVVLFCEFFINGISETALATIGANSTVTYSGPSQNAFLPPPALNQYSADDSFLYYMQDETTISVYDLFTVEVSNPAATKVQINTIAIDMATAMPGSNNFILISGSNIYQAAMGVAGQTLIGTIPSGQAGRSILSFKISPDGQRAILLMDHDTDGVNELYSMNLDGSDFTKISADFSNSSSDVNPIPLGKENFRFSYDGQKIIYTADPIPGQNELYCTGLK